MSNEIMDGNKVLAEFIGGEVTLSHAIQDVQYFVWHGDRVNEFRLMWHMPQVVNCNILLEHCKFHLDRNALHRVWEKFRELRVNILEEYERHYWAIVNKVAYKVAYGTRPDLYNALVEAVKWYNETLKQGGEDE